MFNSDTMEKVMWQVFIPIWNFVCETGLPRLLKSPQISSNLKFLLKSPLISSKNVDFHENLLKSPKISKIENSILAISLVNNTNNLSLRAVKHILDHYGSISLYFLIVYLLKYFIIWSLLKYGIITRMRSIHVS